METDITAYYEVGTNGKNIKRHLFQRVAHFKRKTQTQKLQKFLLKKTNNYVITINSKKRKGGITMTKRKYDAGKIFVKIMASILALFMVLGIAGTLIYYLIAM